MGYPAGELHDWGVIMRSTVLATAILFAATGVTAAQPAEPAASAGQAASAAPASPTEVAEVAPPEERKICRTEKATGSLTRRTRICMTAAQWREIYDRTRRGVGEMQGSASGAPACISAVDVACGGT
jgi:hypothetical protein